jgi:hypothetical protein
MINSTISQIDLADFPDKVAYLKDGWAVRFNGKIESARWKTRIGAEILLKMLQEGRRLPQPESK